MTADAPALTETAPLVVTFKVGRQTYALPLDAVLQVVRLPALTVVPDAPPTLCGLLNLRGTFVPVLNGRVMLGEPPAADLTSQVLVLGVGVPTHSLLVDEVDAVRRFPSASFAPFVDGSALVLGLLRDRDEAVVVLDPEALAARAVSDR
jgi:purine-binding chemotaxis protein CheW